MPKTELWPLNSNTGQQRGTHSHQWHPQPAQPQLCRRDPSSQLLLLANTLPLCCFLFPKLLLPQSKAVAAALQAQSPRGRSCRAAAGAQGSGWADAFGTVSPTWCQSDPSLYTSSPSSALLMILYLNMQAWPFILLNTVEADLSLCTLFFGK